LYFCPRWFRRLIEIQQTNLIFAVKNEVGLLIVCATDKRVCDCKQRDAGLPTAKEIFLLLAIFFESQGIAFLLNGLNFGLNFDQPMSNFFYEQIKIFGLRKKFCVQKIYRNTNY
jgi:hypothetical protein